MQKKRTASFLLAILFALSSILGSFSEKVYASSIGDSSAAARAEEAARYFYKQLPEEAKGFYDAMYNMYEKKIFQTGTGSYDLVAEGHVSQEQLSGYADGNTTLLSYMGAARDAFYADYPEIFYVDFSCLTLRVTQKGDVYCASLGPGRKDTYFLEGFSSQSDVEAALNEYEAKITSIVQGAKNVRPENGKNLEEQQVKYVHDALVRGTSYRLENDCKPENIGHIRTVYGAWVKGESLCEGYARAMKAALDRLNIPCVLILGGYMDTANSTQPHMWNEVQVAGQWYGLDATFDDPKSPIPGEDGTDGAERSDYLLVGEDVMGKRHIPDGVMSEANFEFSYPTPAGEGRMFEVVADDNGLKVELNSSAIEGGIPVGEYKVSYKGMGAAKSIENGKYILMRSTKYYENTGRLEYGVWAYVLPDVYKFEDTDTEFIMDIANAQYIEFAVTSEQPGNYKENSIEGLKRLTFRGDPLLFEAQTEVLYNPNGNYVSPPYVSKATPSLTSRIAIGKTHHMKITFTDKLEPVQGEKANVEVSVLQKDSTALENCKIENFTWDGDSTVEFDFTPSVMWLDEKTDYSFQVTGLVGVDSKKPPKSFLYYATYKMAVCAYRSSGYFWNLFGRPQLLENSDLTQKDFQSWKAEGGNVTLSMMSGLTLVASTPSHEQTDTMNSLLEKNLGNTLLKSETYNINLLTCNQNILSVGDSVRICIGFPPGYGPNDEGVTFKAYHYKRDSYGEIIGFDEIPCTVTRYGLVILCKSFSPFTIAAVANNKENAKTSKTILLSSTQGGKISGAESDMFTLQTGQSKQLTIQADDKYAIDAVIIGGKYQQITNNKSMTVTVDYKDLSDGDIIEAQFIAETVQQQEIKRGETVVYPVPQEAQISLRQDNITVKEKESFEIAPVIQAPDNSLATYQWYKNGIELPGKSAPKLTIASASAQDTGNYTLVVTTSSGIASTDSVSSVCTVKVIPQSTGNTSTPSTPTPKPEEPKPENPKPEETKPGDPNPSNPKPDLKKVTGLKAASSKTNQVKLQWSKAANADGYQIFRYNASSKKFVEIANVSKTSYIDKDITSGNAYRYKVRAYKDSGSKTYYGAFSKEAKVIVKPKAPSSISAKRLSATSVQISFKPVKNATSYLIYKYKKGSSKQLESYKVTSTKLYKYNSKTKKWVYQSKVQKDKNGWLICKLTGFKKTDKNQQYRIKSTVSKSGYETQYSALSKTVSVK